MRYTLFPAAAHYVSGRGRLSALFEIRYLDEGRVPIFASRQDAEWAADSLNQELEDYEPEDAAGNEMQVVGFRPDPGIARHRRRLFKLAPYRLAKKCLTIEDYAEKKLPLVLGHNKRPDTIFFLLQMVQRYPQLKEQLLAKFPG